MSGISPISGMSPPISSAVSSTVAGKTSVKDKLDLSQLIKGALDKVDSDQHAGVASIQDLLAGKSKDILPVVSAVSEADMSFKLLIGVRNKLIEAYKQTMNMQI